MSLLSAYHLEGSRSANNALNNEEFPIYCKLHGDFRYDSLKNLPEDLATQNAELAQSLVNAGNRFGFIVTGYSGRDESVMGLFRAVLETPNPFPHGLFWTEIKGTPVPRAVERLLGLARAKGVDAHYVPVETFDALLLRLWRNIENKPPQLDAKVRKSQAASVHIPLPPAGTRKPLVRFNALPITSLPRQCLELSFTRPKEWDDLHEARRDAKGGLFLTKSNSVWCWGTHDVIKEVFAKEISTITPCDFPTDFRSPENLHFKGFAEEALCAAMARNKPLLYRTTRSSAFLIADPHATDQSDLDPLFDIVGKTSGTIAGLFTSATDDHPTPEKVTWAEAVRVSIDLREGRHWVLLDPDIWIWPVRARPIAATFMEDRRGDRFNNKYNALLDVWTVLVLGTTERNTEVTLSAFDHGSESENPSFRIGTRTAFSRRI